MAPSSLPRESSAGRRGGDWWAKGRRKHRRRRAAARLPAAPAPRVPARYGSSDKRLDLALPSPPPPPPSSPPPLWDLLVSRDVERELVERDDPDLSLLPRRDMLSLGAFFSHLYWLTHGHGSRLVQRL